MSKIINTIQSSDKKEFDKTVNQFLELGCELLEGGYEVINNVDVYSQVIVFKKYCVVEFYDNGQLKCVKNKNEDGEWDGLHYGWYNNGEKRYERTYKDGKQDGVETWWDKYENGQKNSEGTYKDGVEHGLWTTWFENGQKRFEITFKDGKEDGLITSWFENGQKRFETTFKDGLQDGLTTVWNVNGQKEKEGTFKDGKEDGLYTEWYENGKKRFETTYKDGNKDGLWTSWYKNGQKMIEQTFKNGKKDGLRSDWYENGQKEYEKYYSNGIEDGKKTTELKFKDGMLIHSNLSVNGKKVESMIVGNWEQEGGNGSFYISLKQNGSMDLYNDGELDEGESGIWYIIEIGDDIFLVTKEDDVGKTVKSKLVLINNNQFEIYENRGKQIVNRKK